MSALPRDSKLFGDVSDGAMIIDHSVHEKSSPVKGEPGVTVGHENLLASG